VNEPIPEHYFNPHSLATKPVSLYSDELGFGTDRIKIGMLGVPDEPLVDLTPKKRTDYLNMTLFGLGCLFIFIALSKLTYDWWRKRNKK
jgi:hypothetical protein